jgi:hypothetical protein
VNGTNDVHYPLDSYQKSFDVVPGRKQMRIEVKMPHGHPPGWAPKEIGFFIDSYCRDGKPLALTGEITTQDDEVRLAFESAVPVKSAALHYTTDTGLRSNCEWKNLPAQLGQGFVTAPKPPADANTWFISLSDERGAVVTSSVQFQP